MLPAPLDAAQLRLTVDPASLGFADTSELVRDALPWVGQERAHAATRFGLGMMEPGYNLFVLGEVGSGRSSLLRQEALAVVEGAVAANGEGARAGVSGMARDKRERERARANDAGLHHCHDNL